MQIGPTDPRPPAQHPSVASAVFSPLRGPKRSINRRKFTNAAAASSAFIALVEKLAAEDLFLAGDTASTGQALSGSLQTALDHRSCKSQRAQLQAQISALTVQYDSAEWEPSQWEPS